MQAMHLHTAPALLAYLRGCNVHLEATQAGALRVSPAARLDGPMCAAIARHKAELIALLEPGDEVLSDERTRCRDCYHLQDKGNCAMALDGRLPGVARWYLPLKDIPQRCHLFCALPY